ncbi:MAG: hypothetical protein JWP11_1184 [Frankiales bacterium]|jgi:hypothetical protein|nr:hypothetical protein [Frankiales bacterium]
MRRMKTVSAVIAAASLAMVGFGATAANAASGSTTATFTVNGTGLSISVPGTATLGSANTGAASVLGAPLGAVTVTDGRGLLLATWATTVSTTTFTTGSGAATNQQVTAANVTYNPGLLASATTTGTGVFVPGTPGAISGGLTAGSWTVGSGNNTASWNPTLSFTLASDQVAGTYTGTVTHSVT